MWRAVRGRPFPWMNARTQAEFVDVVCDVRRTEIDTKMMVSYTKLSHTEMMGTNSVLVMVQYAVCATGCGCISIKCC